jgi:hypothetical protein
MMLQTIDQIPLWAVFLITTIILFTAAELGFHLGKWRKRRSKDEEKGQAGALMGAALGMLAFLLAFTFGMAGSRQDARKKLVLEEANAIGTAYLRAQILPEPSSSKIKGLLHEYVDVRLKAAQAGQFKKFDQVKQALARSEELHNELWALSVSLAKENSGSIFAGLFVGSLNEVIDLHSIRITKALRSRIPKSIIITLYFVAILTMTLMGYQAGLTGIRTLVARFALILAFASVMLLIVELDRPGKTMIKVSQQAMIDLQASMGKAKH